MNKFNKNKMNQSQKGNIYKNFFSVNHSIDKVKRKIHRHCKNKEIVYKLNFKNDELENIDKESMEIKRLIYKNSKNDMTNPLDLYKSIEKVKTFFPNISNFLETAKNENIEKIIYRRLKNQELENLLKKNIQNISSEKEILNIKINEYIVDLHKNENEIAEKQVSINFLKEINSNLINNKLNNNIDFPKNINKRSSSNINLNKEEKKEENIEYKKIINNNKDMVMLRLKSRGSIQIKDLNVKLDDLKKEKKNILKKVNDLEYKKECLKIKKNILVQELYKHYLNILKDGKDTRNEGLSWAIKEIFLLKKKVLLSYLPVYLDHLGKVFLFNQAKIKLELDEINKKIKIMKQELLDAVISNNSNNNKKEILDNLNKSESDNSANFNNLSKDYSEYDNKNLTYISNRSKINVYSKTKPKINKKIDIKINNSNQIKQKYHNLKNLSNTNYHNFFERNNTSITDLNESTSKIKLKEHNYLKIGGMTDSTWNSTKYYSLDKFKEKNTSIISDNNIPEVIKLNDLEKYVYQKNSESKINNDMIRLIRQFQKLIKKQKDLKKKNEEMKKKEMDRIFNEYLRNNYYQKYKVEKNIVLSSLIGEDKINNELNKQIRRAKKYFDNVKSYSLGHKRLNKKYYKFDKANETRLKTMIGDTFLGGFY